MNHGERKGSLDPERGDSVALLRSDDLALLPVLYKVYGNLAIRPRSRRVDAWVAGQVDRVKAAYPGVLIGGIRRCSGGTLRCMTGSVPTREFPPLVRV